MNIGLGSVKKELGVLLQVKSFGFAIVITNLNFGFVYPLHLQFGRLIFWVKLEALGFCRVVANEMKTELKDLLFPLFSGISNVSKDQVGWRSGGLRTDLYLVLITSNLICGSCKFLEYQFFFQNIIDSIALIGHR